MTEATFHTL